MLQNQNPVFFINICTWKDRFLTWKVGTKAHSMRAPFFYNYQTRNELSSSYIAKICIIRLLHVGQTSKAKYSDNLPNRAHWKKSTFKKVRNPRGNQPTLLVIGRLWSLPFSKLTNILLVISVFKLVWLHAKKPCWFEFTGVW